MNKYAYWLNNWFNLFPIILRAAINPVECASVKLRARWSFPKKRADLQLKNGPVIVYTCFGLQDYCELKNNAFNIESVRIRTKKRKQGQLKNAWRWLNGGLQRLWFTRKKPVNLKNTVKHNKIWTRSFSICDVTANVTVE